MRIKAGSPGQSERRSIEIGFVKVGKKSKKLDHGEVTANESPRVKPKSKTAITGGTTFLAGKPTPSWKTIKTKTIDIIRFNNRAKT